MYGWERKSSVIMPPVRWFQRCVERSERSSDGLWAYVWLNRQGLLGLALDGCPLDLTEDLRSHL